jgi:curved DNA-binding protein CbpA
LLAISKPYHLKNYFTILGLSVEASDDEVRRAYRRLVKVYHPDVSEEPESQDRFIEIKEAYDYLVDPARRRRHAAYHKQTLAGHYSQPAQDAAYKAWAEREARMAYVRMRRKQQQEEEEAFKQTMMYRLLQGANFLYNIIFFIFCVAVVAIPLYRYTHQDELPVEQRQAFIFYLIPIVLGLLFAFLGYYFLFVIKTDEK